MQFDVRVTSHIVTIALMLELSYIIDLNAHWIALNVGLLKTQFSVCVLKNFLPALQMPHNPRLVFQESKFAENCASLVCHAQRAL